MGEAGGATAQVASARNFNSLKNSRLKFAVFFRPANLRNFETCAAAINMMRHRLTRVVSWKTKRPQSKPTGSPTTC